LLASSSRAERAGGTSMPSALAILRYGERGAGASIVRQKQLSEGRRVRVEIKVFRSSSRHAKQQKLPRNGHFIAS
jgi:hypothetical protein